MPLNLIKLCVGADSVSDLEDWIKLKLKEKRKRGDELLDGGSIFWVIRGEITCRERILAIRPFVDKDGIGRCGIVREPKPVLVEPRPYRAFQGWRYLADKDAPRDLAKVVKGAAAMPETLRRELRELGLM